MQTITFRNEDGDKIESRDFDSYEAAMDWAAEWRARSDWFSCIRQVNGVFAGFLNR